jgi:putative NADPH-quinone reductase
MRVLIIFCHPARDSFLGSILDELVGRLERDGHAAQVIDLYMEGFDPVMDLAGWRAHRQGRPAEDGLAAHLQALCECEALVLVYPTWWYGLPAMLKGWLDRVWQPGVAFTLESGVFRTHVLPRIRRFAVIATHGSPRWFIEGVVGNPARRQLVRGLTLQFARGAKSGWEAIYDVDARTAEQLARARARAVDRTIRLLK